MLVARAQLSQEEQNGIIAAFKDPSQAQVSRRVLLCLLALRRMSD